MSFLMGQIVSSVFGKIIRYGLVTEVKVENEWTYLKCDWVDDEPYRNDIKRKAELRSTEIDEGSEWTRVDKIMFIDIEAEIDKLSKLSQKRIKIVESSSPLEDINYFLTESSNREINL